MLIDLTAGTTRVDGPRCEHDPLDEPCPGGRIRPSRAPTVQTGDRIATGCLTASASGAGLPGANRLQMSLPLGARTLSGSEPRRPVCSAASPAAQKIVAKMVRSPMPNSIMESSTASYPNNRSWCETCWRIPRPL